MIFKKFKNLDKKINIKKKDVILFHINLSSIKEHYNSTKAEEISYFLFFLLKSFFSSKGTFLIPSFSYNFCKGMKFDKKKNKCLFGGWY